MQDTFTDIYKNNFWKISKEVKSKSGPGSDDSQTQKIVNEIPLLLQQYDIKSIFDCPCGDFNWMNKIININYDYTGADIVEDLINTNKKHYISSKIKFITFNIANNVIKDTYDLIICRDLLVHFSYNDIKQTLINIKKSKCKYILLTTFPNKLNVNCETPTWRPLNLEKAPFNFPKPITIINENCTEGKMNYTDKSLALWKVEDINEKYM